MDSDQIKGKLQETFGKAEQAVGNAIGNADLANAGAEDRLKGGARETWGNTKDAAQEISNTAHASAEAHTEHAGSLRDRIVAGAENMKDSINQKLDNLKDHERARQDDIDRTS